MAAAPERNFREQAGTVLDELTARTLTRGYSNGCRDVEEAAR
jgi:hypothetical protein